MTNEERRRRREERLERWAGEALGALVMLVLYESDADLARRAWDLALALEAERERRLT